MSREKTFAVLSIIDSLSAVIGIFVSIALTRLLSQTNLGIYNEVLFVFSFVVPFMLLELPTAMLYFLPRYKGADRGLHIESVYIFSIISGIIFILMFFLLSPILESYGTKVGGTAILFILISLAAPFVFVVTFFRYILIAIRELKTLLYFGIIYGLLSALPIAAFVLADGDERRLEYLILAMVAQNIIGATIAVWWFLRSNIRKDSLLEFSLRKPFKFIKEHWREQFKYSIYLVANLPVVLLAKDCDRFIIMGFLSVNSFAIFTIGAVRIPFLSMLRSSLVNVLVPEVAKGYSQTGKVPKESIHAWRKAIRLTALIIIPSFVFLELFSREFIIGMYTTKYADSVVIFRAVLFLVPSYLLSYGIFLQGTGHTKPILYQSIIFIVLNLVLSLILLKFIGLVGLAIGMVLATIVSSGYIWLEVKKVIGEEPFGVIVRNDLLRILAESVGVVILAKLVVVFTCAKLGYPAQFLIGFAVSSGLLLIIWYFCRHDSLNEILVFVKSVLKRKIVPKIP